MKNSQWMYLKLTIVLTSVVISGCSTYGKISALPENGQTLIHKNDQKTLTSEKYNLVGLSPKLEKIKNVGWGEFILTIENRSLNNMQFSMSDISARSYEMDTDTVMALKVFRKEELIKKEKSSQKTRNTWDAIGSVLNVLNVAVSAGSTTSLSDQQKHEDRVAKSKKRHKEILEHLDSLMPENTTVLPGEKMNGLIRVQLPKITDARKKIMFSINLDEEEHKLAFIQEKIEKSK
ncbi:MAG: hypothetical protein L3J84_04355 [Gammaproteobacteria bacterium]|nr:hypothetical protein [Gammaproteobacteria bacterium]